MSGSPLAHLFPWTLGEVRASLATCPPEAFHVTGLRLERLGPDAWWGDLHGYREDLAAPFTWLGFRVRALPAGRGWEVTLPPYLTDLDGRWRALVISTFRAAADAIAADAERSKAAVVDITVDLPPRVPSRGKVGGDRITPGETFTAIWVHHAKRYRFASRYAPDLRVLDAGCGVGYGSRMLGRVARRVVAVDLSHDAAAYASRVYRAPRVTFVCADALCLPFAGEAFDLVSCFEMIEHIEDHEVLLAELGRVLRPDGRLIVSTPNKAFYEREPDPEHFHRGLLTLHEFRRLLEARFGRVELWSQPRLAGLPEITDEFEVQPGADEGQEMFVAVATAPRRARGASTPVRPARVQAGPRDAQPAPRQAPAGETGGLRVLVFNWHEAYLSMLARVGFQWLVADWHRPWSAACRPLPPNARLVSSLEEAEALAGGGGVDVVLCQTGLDLTWLGDRSIPLLYLAHNHLLNDVREREASAAERLRLAVREALERRRGVFVTISEMKRESWGFDAVVIPPGIDVAEYGGYTGEIPAALTVANLLKERAHMLGHAELEAGLAGLPWRVVGKNPTLGTSDARSWDDLKAAYRAHRLYAHGTRWPWEDGYNLALLEAMATGMPVVTWANPTSPIREGLEGFVVEDPETFSHWARRLLDDADLARRIGERARRRVAECFPFDAFAERWRSVLTRAADPSRRLVAVPALPAPPASAPDGRPGGAPAIRAGGARGSGRRARVVLATAWTPISTSMYYERAFRAAGHEVLTWGPHMDDATLARWREVTEQHALKPVGSAEEKIRLLRGLRRPADIPAAPGQPSVRELLEQLPRGWRPDLFVWIDGGPEFLPLELERLDCPTACLVGDSHTQLDWRLAYARGFSHVFLMFNRQHVGQFEAGGCRNVGWLPAACDPDIHRAFDVPKAFDVVFVGQTLRQWHPDRVRLLERLIAAGFDVHVTTRILEEMALAFARGRIVFNRSLAGDLNMRVFEALATGSFLLTDRLPPESGFGELFTDRMHLVCYGEDDLEALARHYLEHPEERAAIARQGRAHVLRSHTYLHRVARLLGSVLGESWSEPARPASRASGGGIPAYYCNARPEVADLVPEGARRILDVGCGAGELGRVLKGRAGREVVGIEAHPAAAAAARQVLDEVLEADLDTLEVLPWPDGSFDCVICADILEHLREPERLLPLLRRLLAPGGRLVLSVPNVRHAQVLVPLLVHGRWQYRDEGILDRTHLRFFTIEQLAEMLLAAGFSIGRVQGMKSTRQPAAVAPLADVVAALGGDRDRFLEEVAVVQYLVEAAPTVSPTSPPPPAPEPAVSIVIPVRNRAEFTARCLQALARTVDPTDTEVIVVDNGSTDDTPSLLEQPSLPVRVIRNEENLGFARACNQGAGAARGALLVFLNNDTEPEPGWLEALRAAAADPGVGIVGARLLYPGTRRIQHAGLALTPDGIPDHVWRNVPEDDPRVTEPRDLDMVTGACLAIRREVFVALGGFDEQYVNGVEDVDLCLAARAAGLRVRYEPRAVVLHHEGVSEGRFDHAASNLARLAQKWADRLAVMERRPAEEFGSLPGPAVAWEGTFFRHHSLAGINRAVCRELAARGVDLVLHRYEPDEFDPAAAPDTRHLARLVERPTKLPPTLRVRHRFPPDFTRRAGERLVVIQPWEFGAVPAEWVRAIRDQVDELWVPSEWVRRCFVDAGVPADRVVTIPNGFDPALFHPRATPVPLPTNRAFRFLYVGGSIHRKGWDVLLRAYTEEFSADDDVCLVIKDHPYYRHRLDEELARLRRLPGAPEVLYYYDTVEPAQIAGFYAAASCLVHPFRGEGFGLPILEAMACGRPVIVTDAGPVREFCPEDAAFFVPAATVRFPEPRVEHLETVGLPWLAEPDPVALRHALRAAYQDPEGCRRRGARAAEHAHARYTWAKVAERYHARLTVLLERPPAPAGPDDVGRAARLLEAGDLTGALPLLAAVIRREPDNVAALLGAAHCALSLDEPGTARCLLTRILEVDPDNAGARAALAAMDGVAPSGVAR